jgi:hypothetical protein
VQIDFTIYIVLLLQCPCCHVLCTVDQDQRETYLCTKHGIDITFMCTCDADCWNRQTCKQGHWTSYLMDHLHYRRGGNWQPNTLWGCQFRVCNTKWLKNGKLRKAILSTFYNISQRNFGILLILWCSFKLWWNFCLDQNLVYNANGPLTVLQKSSVFHTILLLQRVYRSISFRALTWRGFDTVPTLFWSLSNGSETGSCKSEGLGLLSILGLVSFMFDVLFMT